MGHHAIRFLLTALPQQDIYEINGYTFVYTQLPAYKVPSCQTVKYTDIKVLPNNTPFLGIQEWL